MVSLNSGADALPFGLYADTLIFSNVTSGVTYACPVQLQVQDFASVPFTETFESGALQPGWTVTGTSGYRSQITTANIPHGGLYHLTMDSSNDNSYARNEVTLGINLAGYTNVVLTFWTKGFGDESHGPPSSPFTNGADFDGVAVSQDGVTWYEVQGLRNLGAAYARVVVNLDAALAAHGWTYNPTFRIRFNQYDNLTIPNDGIALDDITITGNVALPGLAVTLPGPVTENAGVLSAQGAITLSRVLTNDVVVSLASSDTSEVTVPLSSTILAGQTNTTFDITIVDDADLDGPQTATITATAPGHPSGTATLVVNDNETATLGVILPAIVTEGDGTVSGQITVSTLVATNVTVSLSSSDTAELILPSTVVIPSGQTNAAFNASVVDDHRLDGAQNVTVTAHVVNWTDGASVITVLDNESTNLTLTLPDSGYEGQVFTNGGRVTIAGTLTSNLAVALISDDPSEATVTNSVTIQVGQVSATFDVTLPMDNVKDGMHPGTVTASAAGFRSVTASVEVHDRDLDRFRFNAISSPQAAGTPFPVTLSAYDIMGATITVYQGTADLTGAGDHGPVTMTPTNAVFSNGVCTVSVRVNTPDSRVQLTANDGLGHSAQSYLFTVVVGPVDHFVWSSIASPQREGIPFSVTVTAQDAANNTVTAFTNSTDLSGWMGTRGSGTGRIANAGFELGTTGWSQSQQGRYGNGPHTTVVNSMPTEGITYWYIYTFSLNSMNEGDYGQASQPVDLTGITGLVFDVFLYGPSKWYNKVEAQVRIDGVPVWTNTVSGLYTNQTIGLASYTGFHTLELRSQVSVAGIYDAQWVAFDNLRTVGSAGTPIAITPANASNFVGGVWTGAVTVMEVVSNMFLWVDDGSIPGGQSGVFAVLTTNEPAAITADPQSRTNNPGSFASFTVTVSGTEPLHYQWQKGVLSIPLATNTTFTIDPMAADHAGDYRCIVSNMVNVATSAVATLTVNVPAMIMTPPQSLTRNIGESASFNVSASGSTPLYYQWQKNGANIGLANSPTYTINPVAVGDAGNYRCLALNMAGTATSAVAVLAVNAATPPTGVSASDGIYSNKVQVVWDAVSGATGYEVWRSTANDSGSAGKLADVAPGMTVEERDLRTLLDTDNQPVLTPRIAGSAYADTSAVAEVIYYYWVKTRRTSDVSGFSQSDSGYRKAGLPPPVDVVASDGTYSDKVRIVWPVVNGATSYEVWRAAVNTAGFAVLLGEVGGLEGNDTTGQSGTVYYYWVKSKNAQETSVLSLSDSGQRSGEIRIQPRVTINGVSGEVMLHRGDTLSLAILLMATSNVNADWWVVVAVPGGAWYYYDVYTGGWNPIVGEFTPTYQGALFDFLAPIELLNLNTYWLPAGAYVFYFGVDTAMNGGLDSPPILVYDSVILTVTE